MEANLPEKLSLRHILSQLMGIFDKLGLASPMKMKGAILFRKAWQRSRGTTREEIDWDKPVDEDIRQECLIFFKEIVRLASVRFKRCLKPKNWVGDPIVVTFSDGSDDAFGAVSYLRWEVDEVGSEKFETRLVESKGKLCPLNQKGDTVKSEMCGAVFAARIRVFLEKRFRQKIQKIPGGTGPRVFLTGGPELVGEAGVRMANHQRSLH